MCGERQDSFVSGGNNEEILNNFRKYSCVNQHIYSECLLLQQIIISSKWLCIIQILALERNEHFMDP